MAKDLNSVTLMGRLTADPETKQTQAGKSYSNFSVACNNFKDEGMFFNCTAWGKTSDFIAQHFSKGKKIAIEGELTQRSWEQEGQKRSTVSINVRSVYFVEPKGSAAPVEKVKDAVNGTVVDNAPEVAGGFDPFDDIPM